MIRQNVPKLVQDKVNIGRTVQAAGDISMKFNQPLVVWLNTWRYSTMFWSNSSCFWQRK